LDVATVDWSSLAESVAGALAAGLGITLAFSIGLVGLIRASEARADGRRLEATLAAAIGTLGVLAAIAWTMIGLALVAASG
jgi:hypothetical protein